MRLLSDLWGILVKQHIIDAIIDLAIDAFMKKSTPGEFARIAAHKAALMSASSHNTELADFATLTAVSVFSTEIVDAMNFTARVTDAASAKLLASSNYDAEWDDYPTAIMPKHVSTKRFFTSLAECPDKVVHAFSKVVAPAYNTTQVLDVTTRNKAKRAALYVYADTYSTCRSAYIRALFSANQLEIALQLDQFKFIITTRLRNDLSYDMIDPSFFLRVMSNKIVLIIAGLIFLAGIGAILLAAFHLTPLPFMPLVIAGSTAVVIGTTTLWGGFFARNKCKTMHEANENRAEMSIMP